MTPRPVLPGLGMSAVAHYMIRICKVERVCGRPDS